MLSSILVLLGVMLFVGLGTFAILLFVVYQKKKGGPGDENYI